MSSRVIVGVDLGGTNVKTAMVSWDKQVLAKDSRPTNAEGGPEAVIDAIESSVRDLLAQSDLSPEQVMAVGIGAPGPMDWRSGVVFSPPNLPGWKPCTRPMAKRGWWYWVFHATSLAHRTRAATTRLPSFASSTTA